MNTDDYFRHNDKFRTNMRYYILTAFVILVLLTCFIPVSQRTEIIIAANFDNTVEQIIHPDNWKKWYPGIKESWQSDSSGFRLTKDDIAKTFTITTPRKKYVIKTITLLSYEVTENNSDRFYLTVFPLLSPDSTKVITKANTRLLFKLFSFLHNYSAESTAGGLKSFLENPIALYGFPVEIKKVTDTVYLTTNFVANKNNLFEKLPMMFSDIDGFILKNKLNIINNKDIAYATLNNDSLQVMVGIPVNKIVTGNDHIYCMQMPKGRMLVGQYEGRFDERQSIYRAMQKYIFDHHLSMIAQSYERYLNNRLPVADSSHIQIELYIPIL